MKKIITLIAITAISLGAQAANGDPILKCDPGTEGSFVTFSVQNQEAHGLGSMVVCMKPGSLDTVAGLRALENKIRVAAKIKEGSAVSINMIRPVKN